MNVTRFMKNISVMCLVVVLALTYSACGSAADDELILQAEDISVPIGEQNLQEARHVFDAGKERWDSFDPFAHVMTVGLASMSELRLEFDAEGNLVAENLVTGAPDDPAVQLLPRSVEEVFAELDAMIAAFESGERSVPEEDECGAHFNARFDADWGVPEYYDALGPCDDGVGISVSIARVDLAGS